MSALKTVRRTSLVLLLSVAGCAHGHVSLSRPAPETLPPESPLLSRSLEDGDAWLRHHLVLGEYDEALQLVADSRALPSDRLWRALQEALILRHAGRYQESNERFEWIEREVDRRYTRSLSRGAGSLIVSDRMLAYVPAPSEAAMIPYYRMLNYLALGELDAAAVEARKANALGERLARDAAKGCADPAFLQYFAGLVHEAGGDGNAALVSLRQAEQGFRTCGGRDAAAPGPAIARDLLRAATAAGMTELADSVRARYEVPDSLAAAAGGELVLFLEQGFVTHRAEQALHVPILPGEVEGLESAETDAVAEVAAEIGARLTGNALEQSAWGHAWDDHKAVQWAYALDGAYVLRLAWPEARREPNRPAAVRVWVDSTRVHAAPLGSVSTRVERDIDAGRTAMLTRLVTRGLVKYLASRELEKEAEEEGGELLGFLAGRIANLGANGLERADTRSWSLLPDEIALVRAHLPAGEHRVRVETLSGAGEVLATHDLGSVRVVPGEPVFLSGRVWDFGPPSAPARLVSREPADGGAGPTPGW